MKNRYLAYAALSWLILSAIITVQAQTVVKGTVYHDRNGNGQKERQEHGIEGVAVSNGVEVILTDGEGRYTLPIRNDAVLFVIRPSGYRSPLDNHHFPAFYYIHKPEGSPAAAFAGVSPTGRLPESIDFPLLEDGEPTAFQALLFGDPQPHFSEHIDFFSRRVVAEVEGIPHVAFGISLGDVMDEDLSLYDAYKQEIKKVGTPWYHLIGNHDLNFDAKADSLSDETFELHFGPTNFAFNYGQAHFLVLDDVLYPDPRDGKGYWGGFREEQLAFIENDLKLVDKEKLVVVAMHISPWDEDAFREADKQRLFSLLARFPNVLLVTAHSHVQRNLFYDKDSGWEGNAPLHEYNVGTTSGDFYSGFLDERGIPISTMRDGTPVGYAFLTVNDNRYQLNYKVAGKPADYRMAISAPKVVVQHRYTPADILVNFFMGSDQDSVVFRVDDGEWKAMEKSFMVDPNYADYVYRWNQSTAPKYSRWPAEPYPSSHIWRSRIPANLPLGKHKITVNVLDRYGRQFTEEAFYEIVAPRAMYP